MEPEPDETVDSKDPRSDEIAASPPDRRKAYIAMGIAVVVLVIVFGVILPQLVDWNVVFDVLRGVDGAGLAVTFGLGLIRDFPGGWIYAIVLPGLSIPNGTRA